MGREVVARGVVMLVLVAAVAVIAARPAAWRRRLRGRRALRERGQSRRRVLVTVSGEQVGKVEDIRLSDDGQAVARLTIDAEYAPLREGTRAVVRKRSLSSVANDVIELQLGQGDAADIREGGTIPAINMESDVPSTRSSTPSIPSPGSPWARPSRGSGTSTSARRTALARRSSTSTPRCPPRVPLRRARRQPARPQALHHRDRRADDRPERPRRRPRRARDEPRHDHARPGDRAREPRQRVGPAADLLRRTNTTFVNLRASLDDLDPLVTAAEPVVRDKLRPLFAQLRPFAAGAEPTVRDLSRTIRRDGATTTSSSCCSANPPSTGSPTGRHSATGRSARAPSRPSAARRRAPARSSRSSGPTPSTPWAGSTTSAPRAPTTPSAPSPARGPRSTSPRSTRC
jgi:phospholipid/cholesterol/gamma-HCH transport system substrate-binding protein